MARPVPVTLSLEQLRKRAKELRDLVRAGHPKFTALARLLLEAGADPDDEQALRNACSYPHDDSGLALLLEYGLGRGSGGPWQARLEHRLIEWEDPLGHRFAHPVLPTPTLLVQAELRYAAQWNLPNRVRLLLRRCAEAGIDINAAATPPGGRDPGQPAYKLAVACGNTEIADLLTHAGAQPVPLDLTHQFTAACLRADRPAVDRLLAADPSLIARARNASDVPEPLHQAVVHNRPEAVKLLVSLGFPVNEDWRGWGPPLHTAALTGHLNIVQLLVELGADPTAKAPDDTSAEFIRHDRTPLGWARYHNHHDVVAYLTRLTSTC